MCKCFYNVCFIATVLFLFASCGNTGNTNKPNKTTHAKEFNSEEVKNQFVKANQQLLQKENDEMDYYAKSHKMQFVKTGSGVRYYIYKASEKGDSIKPGMQISMDFVLKLMDGTECYNSRYEGRKLLVIEEEEAESGIHKGLQYLKRGDKAILLIPSSLAHGLLGDFKKIPPQMPIVYDVQVY